MITLEHLEAYGFTVEMTIGDGRRTVKISSPGASYEFTIGPETTRGAIHRIVFDLQTMLRNIESGACSYGLADTTPERHDRHICAVGVSIGPGRGYYHGEWDRLSRLCRTDRGRRFFHDLETTEYHREEARAGII